MKKLRVIISGGGTGGHIFPALAIAKSIQKEVNSVDFYLLVLKIEWKWKKFLMKAIRL